MCDENKLSNEVSKLGYFNFDIHTHANSDLPAFIKKIKFITKTKEIKYVGFSMGTMTMHIALNNNKLVRESISHYVGLAPIISLKNLASVPIKTLASAVYDKLNNVARILMFLKI